MLKIHNLFAGYGNGEVLRGLSLEFNKGKISAILGPNGSGKSTLLKTIDRIIRPKHGTLYLSGQDLKRISSKDLCQAIAYLPQTSNGPPQITVFDAILLGRKPYITLEPTKKDLEVVEKIIHWLGLKELASRNIQELSGGEFQKVLIGRTLAQQPSVLLLDEPVNHLDPKNQQEILSILKTATKTLDITTIIVLHDLNLAFQFADYFVFIKKGTICFEGDLQTISKELIKAVYDINVEIHEIAQRKVLIPL